jgi:hypothetical protein
MKMFKTSEPNNETFHKQILRGKDHKRPRPTDNEKNLPILCERDGFKFKEDNYDGIYEGINFLGQEWSKKKMAS